MLVFFSWRSPPVTPSSTPTLIDAMVDSVDSMMNGHLQEVTSMSGPPTNGVRIRKSDKYPSKDFDWSSASTSKEHPSDSAHGSSASYGTVAWWRPSIVARKSPLQFEFEFNASSVPFTSILNERLPSSAVAGQAEVLTAANTVPDSFDQRANPGTGDPKTKSTTPSPNTGLRSATAANITKPTRHAAAGYMLMVGLSPIQLRGWPKDGARITETALEPKWLRDCC